MSRRVIISKRAQRDIERIDSWWVQNRQLAADLFFLELQDALDLLRRQPTIGQRYTTGSRNFRRVLLRGTRYHLYYRIAHQAQQRRLTGTIGADHADPVTTLDTR